MTKGNMMKDIQTLYTAKLAHYNAWLTDPKREFGTAYPGFPGDKEIESIQNPKKVSKVAKAAKPAKVVAKAVRATVKRSGPTKLEQAKQLYKDNIKLSRENMITLFMEKLSMTKSGATTYFYNAQK